MADDGCNGGDVPQATHFLGGGRHYGRGRKYGYGHHNMGRSDYGAPSQQWSGVEQQHAQPQQPMEKPRQTLQIRSFGASENTLFAPPASAVQRQVDIVGPVRIKVSVPAGATYGDLKHYLGGKISPMFANPNTGVVGMDANTQHSMGEGLQVHHLKTFFANPELNGNVPEIKFHFPEGTNADLFALPTHGAAPVMDDDMQRLNSMFEHGADQMQVHAGYDHHMKFFFDGNNDSISSVTRQIGKALYGKTEYPRYNIKDGEDPKFHMWIADRHTGDLLMPLDFRYKENGSMSVVDAIDQVTGGHDGSLADQIVLRAVAENPNNA